MPVVEWLLLLYPRAWRDRYGEEFVATVGQGALSPQQVIDIVSGAIDAWLSTDVRRASAPLTPSGGPMMLKSLRICEPAKSRYTTRDSLIGAAVMIGATLIFSMLGIAARRAGWFVTGEILLNLAFLGSLTLSLPFWLMKGQPWKAQTALLGTALTLLVAIGYLASR